MNKFRVSIFAAALLGVALGAAAETEADWTAAQIKDVTPAMNPDGYIGGLSLGVLTTFSGVQPWTEGDTLSYSAQPGNAVFDAKSETMRSHSDALYGLDLDLRFPVSQDITLIGAFGASQEVVRVKQISQVQDLQAPNSSLSGESGYCSVINNYSVRIGARVYFKKFW